MAGLLKAFAIFELIPMPRIFQFLCSILPMGKSVLLYVVMNAVLLFVISLVSSLSSSSRDVSSIYFTCFTTFSWLYPRDIEDLTSYSVLLLYSSLSEQILLILSVWLLARQSFNGGGCSEALWR